MSKTWPMVPLGQVARYRKEFIQIDDLRIYKRCRVQLHAQGILLRDAVSGSEIKTKKQQVCRAGEFLVAEIDAKVGGFGVVPDDLDGAIVSSHYFLFELDETVLDKIFLNYFIRTPAFRDQVLAQGSTNYAAIRPNDVLGYMVPLPPLQEQRRIVARIEELAANIKEALDLRRQVEEEAKRVFSGARSEIFKPKKSWQEKSLDEVAPVNMGQSPPGESYNDLGEGVPLLNGPTEFGERYPSAVQWTITPTKLCGKGDILLCVRGATTGRMNWADKEYCIGRGLAALKADTKVCVPEYVYHFVETQTQEMLILSAGSTFPNLPGAKLKTMRIPIPSLPEQRRIVAYLDELQAEVNTLKRLQAGTTAELDALLPAVLDRAFNGEL